MGTSRASVVHREVQTDKQKSPLPARTKRAVTKRKVSGGSRSLERFQETANLLTVIQTCRFQGRSVMDFVAQSLMGTVAVTERPSLISHFNP